MKLLGVPLLMGLTVGIVAAQTPHCDSAGYKPVEGVRATIKDDSIVLTWQGEGSQQLMAQFSVREGQPVVQDLAARSKGAPWISLGKNLTPDFQVTTGKRRISGGLPNLLKAANIDTPEEENRRKWNVFWDAPLVVPGMNDPRDPPHTEQEIHRASVSYRSGLVQSAHRWCQRQRHLHGLTLGIFAGDLGSPFTRARTCCARRRSPAPKSRPSPTSTKPDSRDFTIADDTKTGLAR